ncbi:MAG TPA: NAD(P)-dependent oxidoreductase, partial [Acidobacteria bacterium]|nr:NAD(P)-dependent oxidoreductase [Acidobacteriota bacterium]
FAARTAGAGGAYLEAPVLGSIPEATAGTLIVMAGGDAGTFERWRPVLEVLGEKVTLIGPVGHAAALKLAMNQLIAAMATTYATGLELVRSHGVDVGHYIDTVRSSALYSRAFDKKLPRMLDRNFATPNSPARHMLKDVDLCLDAARTQGLGTELLAALHDLFARTLDLGLADADYSAVAAAVAHGQKER